LVGLAINAAIVILAELKSDAAAIAGDRAAVVDAVSRCGRHIVSTTITTVMGFMPLMLGGGAFWPPFAMVIAGGTVLTTLLSLYLVPVVFLLLTRYRPFELTAALPLSAESPGNDSLAHNEAAAAATNIKG
jgi:multidrug efflux pump subunit AcrB